MEKTEHKFKKRPEMVYLKWPVKNRKCSRSLSRVESFQKLCIDERNVCCLHAQSGHTVYCGQSYKQFTFVNCDSRVIVTSKLLIFTTLDSQITIVEAL